jgi:hypothetical protein
MGTLALTYAESLLLPSQVPTDQQAAKQATTRLKAIGRAEWILSILISTITLVLIVVRGTHAGALWRDECAVVNLARMPSVADIAQNFQHEAFPIPFPFFVRAYTNVFGANDFALRAFGILAGVAVLCAIWISANLVGRRPPLLSLALLGLNTTFLFWGTTVRGYGLGSAFIVLAFGLLAGLLREISPARILAAALVSVAAVQCLVHNLALITAIVASGVLVSIVGHDFRRLIIFLGILALCLISLLPYLDAYSNSWSQVVEFPVTLRFIWNQFTFALGNPNSRFAWFWHIALIVLLATSLWQLVRLRLNKAAADWNLLFFAFLVTILAPVAYYEFLRTLSYLTRSWYFVALVSVLAVALDYLAALLANINWIRVSRVVFAAIALIVLPINAWPKITERQTNTDIVAKKISDEAKPADLIVIAPWQYAISFNRYYKGSTPEITLPSISDLRVHRYDLFRDKMLSEHPIDDVLDKIQQTLAGGNRVWIVGGIKLPPEGQAPRSLPPAPNARAGWDNVAYSDAWMEQLATFVRQHSGRGQNFQVSAGQPVNPFEDVPLLLVDGWQ